MGYCLMQSEAHFILMNSKHTPSKLVPEGRDKTHKRVTYKQKLGVMLELQCHQVAGQGTITAPKSRNTHKKHC